MRPFAPTAAIWSKRFDISRLAMTKLRDQSESRHITRIPGTGHAIVGLPFSAWIVAATFLASAAYYWHGFGPMGDAERYVGAALKWREQGPFLGETHWSLRHLFVVPIAAAFEVLGPSEFAATVPNILYAAGLVAITYFFARRRLGRAEGTVIAILIAISAFFVARPMEIGVYGAEIFYAALSCWLFVSAQFDRRRITYLFVAGAVAGLAWTIREQTFYLLAAFGLLTLFGRRQPLLSLTAIAIGFGAVLLVEGMIYWAAAGDPFYRYRVDLHHKAVGWATLDSTRDTAFAKFLRPFKDSAGDPITTPLSIAGAAAAAFLLRQKTRKLAASQSIFVSFAVISAVAVVISAYGFDLATPRYYPIFPYFICLVLGVAIVAIGQRYGRWASASALALVAFLNAAGEDFSNYNEYAEARLLAQYARMSDGPIYTDPLTASRARYLMRLSGTDRDRIAETIRSDRIYPTGVLFYKTNQRADHPGFWCVLERSDVRPLNWTHAIMRYFGVEKILGSSVERIVVRPEPVEFVRVLRQEAAIDPYSGEACLSPSNKKTGAVVAAPVTLFF